MYVLVDFGVKKSNRTVSLVVAKSLVSVYRVIYHYLHGRLCLCKCYTVCM